VEKEFFHAAAGNGTVADLQRFVEEHGVDIIHYSYSSSYGTALLQCCFMGHEAKVQWLLKQGANVNDVSDSGISCLMAAVQKKGHVRIMKWLLEGGANVHHRDEKGVTALHWAIYPQTFIDAAELLLDYGADLHIVSHNGSTPLSGARSDAVYERLLTYRLHKKLNASNHQVDQLRQELERYKNLTLATAFASSSSPSASCSHHQPDTSRGNDKNAPDNLNNNDNDDNNNSQKL
jgi:ankyrin repeat protein